MNKPQPKPVQKIICPECKEIMAKFYPYGSLEIHPNSVIPPCRRCQYRSSLKSGVAE